MASTTAVPATPPAAPWYRHGWPWFLMAGPAFVICGGAYAMWLAASTSDGLVVDDYYKQGMAINQRLARNDEASRLGLTALLHVDANGDVQMTLDSAGHDAATLPPGVRLRLAHPTRAGEDRATVLVRGRENTYTGSIAPTAGGRWLVLVETDTWRLPVVESSVPLAAVRLEAAASAR